MWQLTIIVPGMGSGDEENMGAQKNKCLFEVTSVYTVILRDHTSFCGTIYIRLYKVFLFFSFSLEHTLNGLWILGLRKLGIR